MLVYFMTIWNILQPLGVFYGKLVYFAVIGMLFPFWYAWKMAESGSPA
jgi:hypothetical protein